MKHPLEELKYCPRCGSKDFGINDERSRHCEQCGLTYYANASAAVAGIIRNKKGEILLTTRAFNPAKGKLDLPGGFVDMNESAEEALKREIEEELGVETESAKYLFSLPNTYEYSGITIHTLDMFFEVVIPDECEIRSQDDVAKAEFYNLKDVELEGIGLNSIRKAIKQLKNI